MKSNVTSLLWSNLLQTAWKKGQIFVIPGFLKIRVRRIFYWQILIATFNHIGRVDFYGDPATSSCVYLGLRRDPWPGALSRPSWRALPPWPCSPRKFNLLYYKYVLICFVLVFKNHFVSSFSCHHYKIKAYEDITISGKYCLYSYWLTTD